MTCDRAIQVGKEYWKDADVWVRVMWCPVHRKLWKDAEESKQDEHINKP